MRSEEVKLVQMTINSSLSERSERSLLTELLRRHDLRPRGVVRFAVAEGGLPVDAKHLDKFRNLVKCTHCPLLLF